MAKWFNASGKQNDIVLSTRVRLARNLNGYKFPNKLDKETALEIINKVENAVSNLGLGFKKYLLSEMTDNQKQIMIEEHFMSPNMLDNSIPRALFISADHSVCIMVNEEDHIRMQSIFAGLESDTAFDIIYKLDKYLADSLDYAVHQKYGYLTSCLTNVGTGLRVSYMLHLPAIVKANLADSLFSSIGKLGATVRGIYGEGSRANGSIFQVSNQITIGKTETDIHKTINNVVSQIIAKERELRNNDYKNLGIKLEDKIMRSYGILKNARLISYKEMMNYISNVRYGITLGIIDTEPSILSAVMVETSPAHLSGEEQKSPFDRDTQRAAYIRNKLQKEA